MFNLDKPELLTTLAQGSSARSLGLSTGSRRDALQLPDPMYTPPAPSWAVHLREGNGVGCGTQAEAVPTCCIGDWYSQDGRAEPVPLSPQQECCAARLED